ncbi:MAG: response regulator [Deltaproteobacteria bacterium]|nr:response regulator [Deltaproteobacteria bacterium]
MDRYEEQLTILMADDDADDYLFLEEAIKAAGIPGNLSRVSDGEELMDYLLQQGLFAERMDAPMPKVIFLDLDMPKKTGFEALGEIRSHPRLKEIPIIVYTTSGDDMNIRKCYDAGANSYIQKPSSFEGMIDMMTDVAAYWTRTVRLPGTLSTTGPSSVAA